MSNSLRTDCNYKNLGTVKEGETVNFEFNVFNQSPNYVSPELHVSCGCTLPELEPKVILPNQMAVIKAKFESKGRRGLQSKKIWLKLPHENNLEFKFDVKVEK